MKKMAILLLMLATVSVFAGYKIVLNNGAVLELKQQPDMSGRMIQGETLDGKRIIVPTRIVNLDATHRINMQSEAPVSDARPQPQVPPAQSEPPRQETVNQPQSAVRQPVIETGPGAEKKPELVITQDTVGKPDSQQESTVRSEKPAPTRNIPEDSRVEERPDDEHRDSSGRTESYWRGKFEDNRRQTIAAQDQLEQVESELNRLFTVQLNTDDDVYRRRLDEDIQKLNALKDRLTKQLDTLKQEKADLLEDARRSGALPGWYRDYDD